MIALVTVEKTVKQTTFNFGKSLGTAQAILAKQRRRLWQFVCLLLFEPTSCLLCQVETRAEANQQDSRQDHLPLCQAIDKPALLARGAKLTRAARATLCMECMEFFCTLTEVKTTLIGDDDSPTMPCFASGFYSGPLQEAIYQIKYLKRPELANALGFALLPPTVALLKSLTDVDTDKIVVVPVPLHKSKVKERGFNQAEELARSVAHLLNAKVDSSSLKRVRATRPQFGLSRGERRRNLDGAFVAASGLATKNVLLVDDVLTSGATIYECAAAVSAAGGTVLGAITLARAKWQKRGQPEESTVVPAISIVI